MEVQSQDAAPPVELPLVEVNHNLAEQRKGKMLQVGRESLLRLVKLDVDIPGKMSEHLAGELGRTNLMETDSYFVKQNTYFEVEIPFVQEASAAAVDDMELDLQEVEKVAGP